MPVRKRSRKSSSSKINVSQKQIKEQLPEAPFNYQSLPDSKERLKYAFKIFKIHFEEYEDCGDAELISNVMMKFLEDQKSAGLSQDECRDLVMKITYRLIVANNMGDIYKPFTSLFLFVASYFGFFTDVMVFLKMFDSTKQGCIATAQGVSLGSSLLFQCISSLAFGQPLWVALGGLIGLKPIIEGCREALDLEPFPNQKVSNETMLLFARVTEVAMQTIPQSVIQTIVLLGTPPDGRTSLQYISLFSSFLATASSVALTDKLYFTSRHYDSREDFKSYAYFAKHSVVLRQLTASITPS